VCGVDCLFLWVWGGFWVLGGLLGGLWLLYVDLGVLGFVWIWFGVWVWGLVGEVLCLGVWIGLYVWCLCYWFVTFRVWGGYVVCLLWYCIR